VDRDQGRTAHLGPDRYGPDALAGFSLRPVPTVLRQVEATRGLVIEETATGFCGAVVHVDRVGVELEDRHGGVRVFPLGRGFLLEGEPVELRAPAPRPAGPAYTASGSRAAPDARARVARASRIFVEGRHDAELVERIWGADLRGEAVAVEYLEGVDNLEDVLAQFRPGEGRRVGVLVDHLVPGSKESRIADAVAKGPYGQHVLVVGHPFVDIWQAVKPSRLGLTRWPDIPRSVEWKEGICDAMGWPRENQEDIARAWQRILSRVKTYADLEPVLLGRVEQLIDFVTEQ
jgi:Protein of unknown function (DUF3097)